MGTLGSDVRFAARMLLKSPVFTAAALVCLALGIGANTAIFSVMYGIVLRALPYEDPERLVELQLSESSGEYYSAFSPGDYLDLREWSRTIDRFAGRRAMDLSLTDAGLPERIRGQSVTPGFFQVLGVEPVLGRFFYPEGDLAETDARSVVLSYASWQSRFGGDPAVIGRLLTLNDQRHTIVGVAPPSFRYPETAEMWVRSYRNDVPEPPIDLGEDLSAVRRLGYFVVIGRLAERVTPAEVQAELDVLAARLTETGDGEVEPLRAVPLHEVLVGDVRPALMVLLGAVCLVLLIGCANVANLLLARASAREREVALRAALGAGRARLLRQLITENLLLGLLGGVGGLLLAYWGADLLVRLAPSDIPRLTEIGVNSDVLLFTLAISLLTSFIFGLLPALQASRPRLQESLKENGRTTEGKEKKRLSAALVVAEVALALVLLCGTGLLFKSLMRLQEVELGFQPGNLLVMQLNLRDTRYPDSEEQAAFVREATERVGRLPGVTSAATVLALPFSGTAATLRYAVEGQPAGPDDDYSLEYQVVTPGYFQTMGIPLLRGQLLDERDDADAPPAIIINETLARRHWPAADPIGQPISLGGGSFEIVGVVGDVRHFAYDRPPRPEAYAAFAQDPWPFMALVVRTETAPLSLLEPVRAEILAIDPDQPVFDVKSMEQVLAESVEQRRFTLQLLGLFTGVALSLALVGIYGVMSYSLSRRIHEMGIRMALGAARTDVLRLGVNWGLRLVALGVIIGLAASVALNRFIASLLYGTSAIDPWVYLPVTLALVAVAALAAYLPAQRAARLEPSVALRHE
jgi:putative ABC transport system permease protein